MKIIISGYGRMGHEIEKVAVERGHMVVATPDNNEAWSALTLTTETCDVVIDFSTPQSAALVVNQCLNAMIPVVSGTTGWQNELDKIKEICRATGGSFFYAPNFSIGVNIFYEVNRKLAHLLSGHDYAPRLNEIHHIHKLDAPSGTAISLANDIVSANRQMKSWKPGESTNRSILPVISERSGDVPGTHIVTWISEADTIEIKHSAHNRRGFATGAVLAAEWLQGRNGVFGMPDLLNTGT
ncbi:MAG: 4-hydroxy-tetrahydrodipicolinate reductase [Bacteroidota bacterium]